MLLEELAHKRLVGKAQLLGNLLDALVGLFQQEAHLQDDITVYPVAGSNLADALDGLGEILGCNVQMVGIPAHAALPAVETLHQ